jgi:hypothetical protein
MENTMRIRISTSNQSLQSCLTCGGKTWIEDVTTERLEELLAVGDGLASLQVAPKILGETTRGVRFWLTLHQVSFEEAHLLCVQGCE